MPVNLAKEHSVLTEYRSKVIVIAEMIGLAALYVVLNLLTEYGFQAVASRPIISPGFGLGLAALLIRGPRVWPALVCGVAVAHGLSGQFPLMMSLRDLLGLTLAWRLLSFRHPFDWQLASIAGYSRLLIAVVLAAALMTGTETAIAWFAEGGAFRSVWGARLAGGFLADCLGGVLITPLILVWAAKAGHRAASLWQLMGLALFFVAALLVGQVIFLDWLHEDLGGINRGYWMYLFITLAAFVLGQRGVQLVLVAAFVQALWGASLHKGFFGGDIAQTGLLNLWCYSIILSIVGMGTATLLRQRDGAAQGLKETIGRVRQANVELEATASALRESQRQLGEEARRFEMLLRTATDGIHVLDGAGNLVIASDSFYDMLGYGHDRPASLNIAVWDSQVSPTQLREKIAAYIRMPGVHFTKHNCRDGRVIDVEIHCRGITLDGRDYLYASSRDITERKKTEESLRLAAMVFQASSEAMAVTDPDGTIITVNPAFTQVTGYALAEVIGKNTRILSSGRHDAQFYGDLWQALLTTGRWQGEIWNRRKDGEIYPEWLTINTIFNPDGTPYRRVAMFADITEQKKTQEIIWHQANFDALTGLPNRRLIRDRLDQEIKKAKRRNQHVAFMFIDLDHFKAVNDTLGHEKGDLLLQEVSHRLKSCVRDTDSICRFGGDEFTVVIGEIDDSSSIDRVAAQILERLSESYHLGEDVAYISASIGITIYPDDADNYDDMLKNADQAMYESKKYGRNCFSYFKISMQVAALSRVKIANDLRVALENQQFEIYYQPIVDLVSGTIPKAEALIRWHHPARGLVSPAEFIPIAEETGLIVAIGEWVFREATEQAVRWQSQLNRQIQISVNKSPVQFRDNSLQNYEWGDYVRGKGLGKNSINVEITEGLLLDANDCINSTLTSFRESGIEISLDDFGTGYSSLSYLKRFDINYLKIDQSFVRGLTPQSSDHALCEAIIVMAHKLGIKVIAEGIETESQRALLAAAGCDYGQGYLFSRPVPAAEFERLFDVPTLANRESV